MASISETRVVKLEDIINKFDKYPIIEGKIRELLLQMSLDYHQYCFFTNEKQIVYAILNNNNNNNNDAIGISYIKEIGSPVFCALKPVEKMEVSKYICYIIYLIRLGYNFPTFKKDVQKISVEFDVSNISDNGSEWKKTTDATYPKIIGSLSRNLMLSLKTNRTIRIFKFVEWEEGKLFAHYLYDILYELYEYDNNYCLSDIREIFDIFANHAKHLSTIKPHVSYKYVYGTTGNYQPDEPININPFYGKYSTYVGQPWHLESGKLFVPIRIPWCNDHPETPVYLSAEDHLMTNIYLFMKRYMNMI